MLLFCWSPLIRTLDRYCFQWQTTIQEELDCMFPENRVYSGVAHRTPELNPVNLATYTTQFAPNIKAWIAHHLALEPWKQIAYFFSSIDIYSKQRSDCFFWDSISSLASKSSSVAKIFIDWKPAGRNFALKRHTGFALKRNRDQIKLVTEILFFN